MNFLLISVAKLALIPQGSNYNTLHPRPQDADIQQRRIKIPYILQHRADSPQIPEIFGLTGRVALRDRGLQARFIHIDVSHLGIREDADRRE